MILTEPFTKNNTSIKIYSKYKILQEKPQHGKFLKSLLKVINMKQLSPKSCKCSKLGKQLSFGVI